MGAGIEPREAASKTLDVEHPPRQVDIVDVGDLQFAAGRGLKRRCDLRRRMVVDVETGHSPMGTWLLRFFDDGDGRPVAAEFDHAIGFRVTYLVGKDRGTGTWCRQLPKHRGKPVAVKDVIP